MSDFADDISLELEGLFREGELEVLVRRTAASGQVASAEDLAVKAIHLPTGTEVVVDDFGHLSKNRAMSILRLYLQVHAGD